MKPHLSLISLAFLGSVVGFCGVLKAEGTSTDKAAAQALFNEGVTLVADGRFAEGCQKFEGSQAFDPTLGTTLRLADCYERAGKTASAWALFKQAEGEAHRQGESEREAIAQRRSEALFPNLSYLTVQSEGNLPPQFTIELNGAAVPLVSLGAAIPVDPGQQEIKARAPSYEGWSSRIEVSGAASRAILRVPPLTPLPEKPPASVAVESEKPSLAAPPLHRAEAAPRTQRTVGIVATSLGVAGVVAGAGLAIYADHENRRSRSDSYCPLDEHTGCTPEGLALRQRAQSFARAATITLISGGAVLAGGIVLWSSAPSENRQLSAHGLRLMARVVPGGFASELGGSW